MSVRISTKDAPRYTFWVDDVEYAIPAMGSLPIPFLRKYAKASGEDMGVDFMLDLISTQTVRADDGSKADGLIDTLGVQAVAAIMADYTASSEDDLGESSASSD